MKKIYQDVVSGNDKSYLFKRFDLILNDLIQNDIDELVIHDPSRISRDHSVIYQVVEKFKEQGKVITPVFGSIDVNQILQ
ncbi:hypothetical protein D3C74_403420 [compost metagenome]